MKKIIYILCFYFTLTSNSQVATATKKIVKKFGKEITDKGLSKTSKEASKELSEKLSKSAVKKITSFESRKIVASKLDKEAIEKFLGRLDFKKNEVEALYESIGKNNLRKVYSWITNDMDNLVKRNLLMDVQDVSFFNYLNSSSSHRRAYEKAVYMGRKFRKNKDVLKQIENNISPVKIKTINDGLKETVKNGIKITYKRKTITLPNGLKISGIFPAFKHISKVKLPDYLLNKSDVMQMNYAFMKFKKKLLLDPELQKKFSKSEIEEMLSRKITSTKTPNYKIKGYTWHHSEEIGVLELVETKVHNAGIPHDGGSAIWSGGKVYKVKMLTPTLD
tara:strand:+ start:313 stop:1314 length:1002 start_codon:yes stop_codon:yes gene_type:complete